MYILKNVNAKVCRDLHEIKSNSDNVQTEIKWCRKRLSNQIKSTAKRFNQMNKIQNEAIHRKNEQIVELQKRCKQLTSRCKEKRCLLSRNFLVENVVILNPCINQQSKN